MQRCCAGDGRGGRYMIIVLLSLLSCCGAVSRNKFKNHEIVLNTPLQVISPWMQTNKKTKNVK
jgi:hypothetical protein